MTDRHPAKRSSGAVSAREEENDLPRGLGKPARRALAGAGYSRLEQFAEVSEREVLGLHGMGPGALGRLRDALAARDLSFADEPRDMPRARTRREMR